MSKDNLGSTTYQVTQLFKNSGINCIGQSKHEAKLKQMELGAKTSQEINKGLGIHSISTAVRYQKTWRHFAQFAKDNYGVNDISKLNSHHVRGYMKSVIDNSSLKTIKVTLAALNKMESALTMQHTENYYDWQNTLNKSRAVGKRRKSFEYKDRAYQDVNALIKNIKNEKYSLVARIMYETGCRISEASKIKASQIADGKFYYKSKGGKDMVKTLPQGMITELQRHFDKSNGLFSVNQNKFRSVLKHACNKTGQVYTGSHGIRWTKARELYEAKLEKLEKFKYFKSMVHKLKEKGINIVNFVKTNIFGMKAKEIVSFKQNQYEQVLRYVSEALGHNRPSITRHYLGFGASC